MWIITHKIKYAIVNFGHFLFKPFKNKQGFAEKLYKYFYQKKIFWDDILLWRRIKAKELGVKVGENCWFYSLNIHSEPYLVEIGDNVIVSGGVDFVTHDGSYRLFMGRECGCLYGKIKIGNNCFIGLNSIITMGTIIGDNCIVGAGSVVRGNIPANSVVMGNPAKVVFKTEMAKKMVINSKGVVEHSWESEKHRKEKIIEHFFRNEQV